MKQIIFIGFLLIVFCQCTKRIDNKKEILSSEFHDNGNIVSTNCKFIMYSDSTYIFTVNEYQEYRHEKNEIFRGRFILHGDTIVFFPFQFYFLNSEKAIIKNNFIEFLDGDRPFKMKIAKTILSQNNYTDTVKFNDYSFFTYNSNFYRNFSGEVKPYDLNTEDLNTIDSLLNLCINQNSESISRKSNNYFKQCIAFRNSNNEKEVWINLLCKGNRIGYLHYYIIDVNDGGDCFFNLKINLTKRKYYDLYVNGSA